MKAWMLGGIIKIQGCFKEKRTHFFLGFPIKRKLHSKFSLCHGKTGNGGLSGPEVCREMKIDLKSLTVKTPSLTVAQLCGTRPGVLKNGNNNQSPAYITPQAQSLFTSPMSSTTMFLPITTDLARLRHSPAHIRAMSIRSFQLGIMVWCSTDQTVNKLSQSPQSKAVCIAKRVMTSAQCVCCCTLT